MIAALMGQVSPESIRFISSVGPRANSPKLQLVIAKVLSSVPSIPSAPVEDVSSFFRMSVEHDLIIKLSKLNDVIPLDCDKIIDYTLRFYGARYAVAHPNSKMVCYRDKLIAFDFFGIGQFVTPDMIEDIGDNAADITRLYNGFAALIGEL